MPKFVIVHLYIIIAVNFIVKFAANASPRLITGNKNDNLTY